MKFSLSTAAPLFALALAGPLCAQTSPGAPLHAGHPVTWKKLAESQRPQVRRIPHLGRAVEFYFSADSRQLIGNAKLDDDEFYRVYILNVDGSGIRRVTDRGAGDACSFFFPDGQHIVWTSTRDNPQLLGNWSDPKRYPQGAELYVSKPDGTGIRRLTNNRLYEAEVTVSPKGDWIVFARQQANYQIDLWRIRPDGSGEEQITHTPDWQEGGVQYLADGKTLLYRAWQIQDEGGAKQPLPMSLFLINHDGTGLRQLTHEDGVQNWSPYPAPDGKHGVFVKVIIEDGELRRKIFLINYDTGEQTQLTYGPGADITPAISPDGKLLSFSSSRGSASGTRDLFLHLADISAFELGPPSR